MTKRMNPVSRLTPACQRLFQQLHSLLEQRSSVAVICALATTVLAACTSTPLPPWVPQALKTTSANADASNTAAQTTAPAASAVPSLVQTFPVAPPTSLSPQSSPQTTAENAAISARFPPPSGSYSTPGLQPGRSSFTTHAESSAWLHTQAQAAKGIAAAVIPIGRSQRGQQLEALVVSRSGGIDPASLVGNGRPTVLLLGQNSPEEPAATEALLVMARELTQGLLRPNLDRINVIVLPFANADTPNGPAANQDHLALTSGESQAVATLVRDYRPAVVVDVREYEAGGTPNRFTTKFGAVQKFDLLFQYAMTPNTPELLTRASEEWFRRPLLTAMKNQQLSMEWAYTNPADPDDKKLSMGNPQPDAIRNVSALKNSIGLLVQSRGAGLGRQHIQRRVLTQVTALSSVLASTATRAADLVQVQAFFDKEVSALACKGEAVVLASAVAAQYDLQVLDPLSGTDKVINVDWDSSLALNRISVRSRPCGYWLSATASPAVDRLLMHGVKVQKVQERGAVLADSFRDSAAGSSPGGTPASVRPSRGLLDIPRGSFYVPLSQPLANLVIAALEPDTPFSYSTQRLVPDLQSSARIMAPPMFKLEDLP